jgi:imidazolonepropionase-like amidohydrolase
MKKNIVFFILGIFLLSLPVHGQQKITAIKAGRLVDVISGKILTNQVILIKSDTIVGVGPSIPIPPDAEIIDLSNATVLPGLIDCHTHLTSEPGGDYYADIFRNTAVDYAMRAPIYAKRTLEAGFTTCRDLGAGDLVDISLRNAINEGIIDGPRM